MNNFVQRTLILSRELQQGLFRQFTADDRWLRLARWSRSNVRGTLGALSSVKMNCSNMWRPGRRKKVEKTSRFSQKKSQERNKKPLKQGWGRRTHLWVWEKSFWIKFSFLGDLLKHHSTATFTKAKHKREDSCFCFSVFLPALSVMPDNHSIGCQSSINLYFVSLSGRTGRAAAAEPRRTSAGVSFKLRESAHTSPAQ